jgi:hypothetical protein
VNFYLSGEFQVFEKQDVVRLLQLAGAKILKREPKLERELELVPNELAHHLDRHFDKSFSCCNFILYDRNKIKEIKHDHLYTVSPTWLFACIDYFRIIHPNDSKSIQ